MSQARTAYARRFGGSGEFIWDLPPREVFEPHICVGARVFDLGCARGDFSNNGSVANVSRDFIFPEQFLERPKAAQASQPTLGLMRCVLEKIER